MTHASGQTTQPYATSVVRWRSQSTSATAAITGSNPAPNHARRGQWSNQRSSERRRHADHRVTRGSRCPRSLAGNARPSSSAPRAVPPADAPQHEERDERALGAAKCRRDCRSATNAVASAASAISDAAEERRVEEQLLAGRKAAGGERERRADLQQQRERARERLLLPAADPVHGGRLERPPRGGPVRIGGERNRDRREDDREHEERARQQREPRLGAPVQREPQRRA